MHGYGWIPRHALAAESIAPFGAEGRHHPDFLAKRAAQMNHRGADAYDEIKRRDQGSSFLVIVDCFGPVLDADSMPRLQDRNLAGRFRGVLQAHESSTRHGE